MRKGLLIFLIFFCSIGAKKHTNGHEPVDLDFQAKNNTNRTLYVTCFYYALRETGMRWGWYKSGIYKLEPNQKVTIDIHTISDKSDANSVYGYLGVFLNEDNANNAIYELMKDSQKIDLPRLVTLKNQVVNIQTEVYGFKGEVLDFEFKKNNQKKVPELDFIVENQSGKDLYITGFIYQQKENHPQWIFDKTDVLEIKNGEKVAIDVDTLVDPEDRRDTRGYIALFDHDKKQEALSSTFSTLKPDQKLNLGYLKNYQNKKVIIIPKEYGVLGGFDDRYPNLEYIKKTQPAKSLEAEATELVKKQSKKSAKRIKRSERLAIRRNMLKNMRKKKRNKLTTLKKAEKTIQKELHYK